MAILQKSTKTGHSAENTWIDIYPSVHFLDKIDTFRHSMDYVTILAFRYTWLSPYHLIYLNSDNSALSQNGNFVNICKMGHSAQDKWSNM